MNLREIFLAVLPPLPVWWGGRGRERRAGEVRASGGAATGGGGRGGLGR
jgi:hypothetical protein